MQSKISTPIAVVVILIALAVVGFFVWRSQAKSGPTNEKGIPLPPAEARPGADAMQNLWKSGVKPPSSAPQNPTQPPQNP
jgi:flagellar basal body-associated protein FliL